VLEREHPGELSSGAELLERRDDGRKLGRVVRTVKGHWTPIDDAQLETVRQLGLLQARAHG